MNIRLKDIAKKLNISESTVSRALSGHPKISKETKEKISKLAKNLNYRPNLIAKSLKTKKTKTIGLIISDITNPFYPEIVKGCEDIANNNDLNIILCNSDYNTEKEKKYLNILLSKKVDGILITPVGEKNKIVNLLKDTSTPLVFIDTKPTNRIGVACVYTDQEYGAYLATKHLIKLGHKKIAIINGPKNLSSCKQVENGYIKALSESNMEIKKEFFKEFDLKAHGGYKALKDLLKLNKKERPTAAIFISDISAIAAYDAVTESGLKIPEDFSIIGDDDIPASKNFSPPLTTISHPKYEMGVNAVKLLVENLNDNKNIKGKQIRFLPKLVIRKSTSTLTQKSKNSIIY